MRKSARSNDSKKKLIEKVSRELTTGRHISRLPYIVITGKIEGKRGRSRQRTCWINYLDGTKNNITAYNQHSEEGVVEEHDS